MHVVCVRAVGWVSLRQFILFVSYFLPEKNIKKTLQAKNEVREKNSSSKKQRMEFN